MKEQLDDLTLDNPGAREQFKKVSEASRQPHRTAGQVKWLHDAGSNGQPHRTAEQVKWLHGAGSNGSPTMQLRARSSVYMALSHVVAW